MGIRVFVLEDDRMLQGVLRDWLERNHHEVVTFCNADEFCRAAAECRCDPKHKQRCGDILICDQRLPGINGIELIRHLRTKGCKVRNVALMSGWWNEQWLAEAAKLGITVFHKPREMGRILDWLKECIHQHDADRHLMTHFSEPRTN